MYAQLGREIPAAVRHKYHSEAAPAPLSATTQKLRRATDAEQTLAAKKACSLYKEKEAGSSLAKVTCHPMLANTQTAPGRTTPSRAPAASTESACWSG